MIYILDKFDLDILEWDSQYLRLELHETGETNVSGLIRSGRTRTIIEKQEVVGVFNIKDKVQMAHVDTIKLKEHDRLIVFTANQKFFIFRVEGTY